MEKFIRKHLNFLNNLKATLLLLFLVIIRASEVDILIKLCLGISLFSLELALSLYEDIANKSNRIISRKYKKNGIHSLFNPFSWEKEWKYHYFYFLILHNRRKSNLFYIIGYVVLLLPYRICTNYFFFHFPKTTTASLFGVSILSYMFILSSLKYVLWSILIVLSFGNCYISIITYMYKDNNRVRMNVDKLCLNRQQFLYFFLGSL